MYQILHQICQPEGCSFVWLFVGAITVKRNELEECNIIVLLQLSGEKQILSGKRKCYLKKRNYLRNNQRIPKNKKMKQDP